MASVLAAFYGITVTLSDTSAHNLLVLLQAVDTTLLGVLQNCRALTIESDAGNTGQTVAIGDSNVSTTRMGRKLAVNGVAEYYPLESLSVPLEAIWVLASGGTLKLNVQVFF